MTLGINEDILIDVTRLIGQIRQGREFTGNDRVCIEYIKHFSERGRMSRAVVRIGRRSVVLRVEASRRLFSELCAPTINFKKIVRSLLWRAAVKPWALSNPKSTVLINVNHDGLEQKTYCSDLQKAGVHIVAFIHDLIALTHPELCRPGEKELHSQRIDFALSNASGIIVSSKTTQADLHRYALAHKKEVPPSLIVPLSPSVWPVAATHTLVGGQYFTMLGTIEPKNNYWMMLQLWRRLVEKRGVEAPTLVIIGQYGWGCEHIRDMIERCDILKGRVIHVPHCTERDLGTYLHYSQALLFPAFVDGYGVPLAEAIAAGIPVIASTLPIFKDVAADIPEYADPLNGPAWMSLIEDYHVPHSPRRHAQLQRMKRFKASTWTSHFDKVEQFLFDISTK